MGRDLQIVSWRGSLSGDLEKLANKQTIVLDECWRSVCEIRRSPELDEGLPPDEKHHDGDR